LGGPHAEVHAIREALSNTKDLSNCTLYVSLEPCSHQGKTPPCTDLILSKSIKKVVIASMDPNPRVSGADILRENGVEVLLLHEEETVQLNRTFNINQSLGRPHYLAKIAMTIDGKIADANGNSKWLSNEISRKYVHESLRMQTDAILSTAKTVIQDDAKLNIRLNEGEEELTAIIVDKSLSLLEANNQSLRIHYPRKKTKLILLTNKKRPADLPEHVLCAEGMFTDQGQLDFQLLNRYLIEQGIHHVLVEAGGKLCASLYEAGQMDDLILFTVPRIMGKNSAIPAFDFAKIKSSDLNQRLAIKETMKFEHDIMTWYQTRHD
jgi:diaminohydroxyphosphoribosylaminopyrimidine deaminase/5-amino-6-(5-phosphoribosylamino)uracil reductase